MLPLDRQNKYRRRYAALVPGWRSSGDLFESLVRESITPTTHLLDIGSGRGGLIEKIHTDVAAATTLDPDFRSLVEHRTPTVPRIGGLADALPFPAQSFDLITAVWLLEHLTHPQTVFSEIHRVLKPGGRFIFLTPNALHPLLITNHLARLIPTLQRTLIPRLYARAEADTFPVQYQANTRTTLHTLCQRVGLHLELKLVPDPTYTAFNEPLFRISTFLERFIPTRFKIHLIGVAVKKT